MNCGELARELFLVETIIIERHPLVSVWVDKAAGTIRGDIVGNVTRRSKSDRETELD